MGLEVKVSSIANTNDIQQVTESLASETDAIFVPIDNTIASAMSTVVKVTDAKKNSSIPFSRYNGSRWWSIRNWC